MTLPDKLTAAEFERLKAQEQRMLNSGSWVPQSEDRLTAQVNAAAADSAAPDSMTAEQADVAEAQQSVMAETQFGRSVGIRPDYSQPPAKDPAEDEPKTINDLRKRQQDLYNDPSYDMPFEEWQDFTRWQKQNESEVGSFIGGLPGMAQSLGQLGVGLVKERAQQAYRATAGLDPIGAAATEVATFKEMGRKIGVGLTQLSDWVGGKVNDIVESGRRVGQVQQNVIRALRDSGQLTGDPIKDNTTIQKALEEAAAQGMYEPTQQQAEEDEEVGYQRYQRKKAYDREYAGITEFSIGGNRMTLPNVKETVTMPTLLPNTEQSKGVNVERQVFQPQEATSTVGAMAFSPENALPIGVGVLARARMLRRLASVTGTPLRATETAMASVDDWLARTADRVTSKVPFVGDLPLNQRAYALGAAGGVGAYLDATTDSPVIDVIAKPLIVAGLVLPAAKAAGGTIRRVGAGAGAGWQVIKEMDAGAVGSARAETAARMAASGKFNPRYSKYMERGAQGGVESTLRRVSQNPDMPETLRRVARSADNIGITQLARGIDDAVSSSVAAGVAATPFALVAPDSETAGGIVGGALLLGGTLGTAGRVIGRRSARTDADIARMMVDVEMAGGDAGSLGALSYSGLDLLAAMQGITSGKVDFVPLRAQEYRANADVRASGGETVAGLHIEKAADGRAKVYVNMGHTAPIAGRVSIKPIQITRNGKTEDANVVRIKGEDGQSDFTVVPREYPLLVKSGDFVEPNARLARGLSPTHVMPHEIGHAILTSSILNGSIRDDLRNLVNQRYDTAGVEARGREYVTRIVDKDILAGAHDQLPDKLTQQEFDEISSGRRTMADVLKGKPVSDAQREQMITDRYNEMRERSIAEGNNPDGLDVFRDEIVAETFSSLSDSLDFRRMRAGGPQVMESVLAATARVFETMGVKFDRSTGKLMDNPSVVFRDNPLMQDPIMRKRMQEHLRNYEAWMLGMEQAGAREQKGTQISVDGSAESARRSTHTKLRANDNGVLENDLIYIDQNGQAQWKPQEMLDEQEKGRSAQVGQLYDKNKILPPNSAEFGLRRAGVGRTVISGPTLPAKFDVLRWFPKHIREMARMLEAGREGGASHIFDYNTIGTGEGGRYRVINRGDVRAIIREGAFLGWEATKNGHLKAVVMDLNAFRSAAMRAINRGELGIFNNDMGQLQADLMVYLANHKNGLPGEATIGQQKRDMLNGLIGTGTAVQRDINPLYADLNPRGSVRSFRFDRINDITPTGRDGYHFDYDKIKNNRMPSALPQAGMGMPEVATGRTRGQAMPDVGDVSSGLPRRSMESRGGAKIDEDGTVIFQGREPKDWAPEDFAKFGKEFGVRNLGPLSKVSNIVDELGRPLAQIPGGLDGKFTYYDLLWLKANPVDVKSLPVELHGKLTAKLARTMTPERGNDVQKFNGILFGMLSPNSPLLPNEFGQARMRFESMDDIRRFASLLPDNPTKEQRKAVNKKLKKELGFTSAKSGGLGIGISVDLSNIVMAAKMFVKKPDFFIKKPNESWANFVDKLTTQVGGLGTKTASFGGVWQDPLMAGISAMDRHMARAFSEELLNNPEIRGRFEGMVVKRFNDLTAKSKKTAQKADAKIRRAKTDKARAKAIEDKQDAMQNLPDPTALKAETLDDVLGQAEIFGADRIKDFVNEAVFAAMGSRKAKYLVKGGAVNPKLPESLQGVEWVEQPKDFQVMSDAYRLALEINAKRAKEIGIEVFPSQWTLWDRIRGRVEPHEAMFPGLEKLPALNDKQLSAAYAANKQAGYARNVKAGQEWKRKSGLSPSSLAYFTPAVLAAGAASSAMEE